MGISLYKILGRLIASRSRVTCLSVIFSASVNGRENTASLYKRRPTDTIQFDPAYYVQKYPGHNLQCGVVMSNAGSGLGSIKACRDLIAYPPRCLQFIGYPPRSWHSHGSPPTMSLPTPDDLIAHPKKRPISAPTPDNLIVHPPDRLWS